MSEIEKENEVKKIYEETTFEWKIEDFFSFYDIRNMRCRQRCKYLTHSPNFSILDISWNLCLEYAFPADTGNIRFIFTKELPQEHLMEYNIGIRKADGSIEHMATGILKRKELFTDDSKILKVSEIEQRKSELAPQNVLTITCSLKFYVSDQPSLLYEPKGKKLKDDSLLFEDYKKMLQAGKNYDLILKVADKEFPVHRDILSARSKVFESMLNHDMKEKNSGVVEIPDCDPQAMEQFLLYLYCGGIETLDEFNVLGLYYAADKYERNDLKEECRDCIKKWLSVTNICQVLQLSVNHCDSDIQEHATQYFINNVEDILRAPDWPSFNRDNQTLANELVIKSIQILKEELHFLLKQSS